MSHHESHRQSTADLRACIEACTSCAEECTSMIEHCLTRGGPHAESSHIATMLDCVDICRTSANFMLRNSSLHTEICGACAVVCRACEESCRALEGEMMKECADECARCAESCEKMAGAAAA